MDFKISSEFRPTGDQPQAIEALTTGLNKGFKNQVLLGVTGSGKTFTIANVIKNVNRPALVIAHNKTLAAQLAAEFRTFFPDNAVEYFVSYYDFYQPEAYLANTDIYIEKEVEINEEIDRLRHAATQALLSRRDVIIVASVSCIYGLGSPEIYAKTFLYLEKGKEKQRDEVVQKLIGMYFNRSEILKRGTFRLHGQVLEIMPADEQVILRIEFNNEKITDITVFENITYRVLDKPNQMTIYPAKHFVVEEPRMQESIKEIEKELAERLNYFDKKGKYLEGERLKRRTKYDLELLKEIGYCSGIENYSRFLTGRKPGQAPYTLLDYFPKDYLIVIDESHVTVPQIEGMYEGDKSRKDALIEHGFRLPSARDNRPLTAKEFFERAGQIIYTSATPAKFEIKKSDKQVEQIIRPTGLVDPEVLIRPIAGQVDDLTKEIESRISAGERILVTTLTKRMAEDLSEHFKEKGIKAEYLHSEVETLDRIGILNNLRKGDVDVLVGVNLLREGLDLPEVSLVAILDADKEGFLRSETSLVQTIGRAARNVRGKVILYADNVTGSMSRAIDETNRRRKIQIEFNQKNNITPKTIQKSLNSIIDHDLNPKMAQEFTSLEKLEDLEKVLKFKQEEMHKASKSLEFEQAAIIRDEIIQLRKLRIKK